MAKPAQKSASVITYLIEELGDARLRCDQLVRYINDAVKLIDKSPKKDHFFEVAGHLIEGIPATVFKLEKALQAVALAATKLDYEELKQELRPEKVQQLEKVLEEVRIRPVHRRSEPVMNIKQAIENIQKLAQKTRISGTLPTTEVLGIITDLEVGVKMASDDSDPAIMLDRIASALSSAKEGQQLSRVRLAGLLRRLVADELVRELTSEESFTKESAEEMTPDVLVEEMLSTMKMVARSAGVGRWRVALLHLTNIVDGIGNLLAQMGDEGALVKTQALSREVMQMARMAQRMRPEDMIPVTAAVDPMRAMERMLDTTKDQLKEMEHSFGLLQRDPGKNAPQKGNFASAVNSLMSAGRMVQRSLGKTASETSSEEEETKESRFEEGKPADPTRNMNKDDAAKWKSNTEEYGDKFKKEARAPLGYQFFVERFMDSRRKMEKVKIYELLDTGIADTLEGLGRMDPPLRPEIVRKGILLGKKLRKVTRDLLYTMIDVDNLWEAVSVNLENQGIKVATEEEETKESRFEEGRPADPTKNMDPEDAKKWKVEHEKNKDNFKGASDPWKVGASEEEEKEARFEEGKPADPTKKMSPEDAEKWKSNTDKYEDKFKKASEEEEKEARFEEGKPADPTKQMSPEDAKKWKSNTEEYGDKFKVAAGAMSEGKWYKQSFQTTGDIYFYAQEQLKNKGFKGLMVAIGDSGRAQKAKKDSVSSSNFRLWKEVPESNVPSDVKSKAHARMASENSWKA